MHGRKKGTSDIVKHCCSLESSFKTSIDNSKVFLPIDQ